MRKLLSVFVLLLMFFPLCWGQKNEFCDSFCKVIPTKPQTIASLIATTVLVRDLYSLHKHFRQYKKRRKKLLGKIVQKENNHETHIKRLALITEHNLGTVEITQTFTDAEKNQRKIQYSLNNHQVSIEVESKHLLQSCFPFISDWSKIIFYPFYTIFFSILQIKNTITRSIYEDLSDLEDHIKNHFMIILKGGTLDNASKRNKAIAFNDSPVYGLNYWHPDEDKNPHCTPPLRVDVMRYCPKNDHWYENTNAPRLRFTVFDPNTCIQFQGAEDQRNAIQCKLNEP